MIYEEKERTISNPSPKDVSQLIDEVKSEAISKNASAETMSIKSEYISERFYSKGYRYGQCIV